MNFQVFRALSTFIFIVCSFIIIPVAQAKEHITTSTQNEKLIINISLDKGEHVYWYNQTKLGLPTHIELIDQKNVESFHAAFPWPEVKKDQGLNIAIYHDNVQIPVYIKPQDASKPVEFKLQMSYATCSDKGCFPGIFTSENIIGHFAEPNSPDESAISEVISSAISGVKYDNGKLVVLSSHDNLELIALRNKQIYTPISKSLVKDNSPSLFQYSFDIVPESEGSDQESTLQIFNNLSSNVLSFKDEDIARIPEQNTYTSQVITTSVTESSNPSNPASTPYFIYVLMAFAGGFILNLMPCVLPILSLKLYSFTHSASSSEKRIEALLSFATITLYFTAIGLTTILMRSYGAFFVPGLNLQIPELIIFCLIIIVFSMGIIQDRIDVATMLSSALGNFANYQSSNKYIGTIVTSLITTILATPCTAPFLATSIAFALSQNDATVLLMFVASGVGFGLPYIIIILFPGIANILPKSGKWQNYLKMLFVALLVATILWLCFILNSQIGPIATISALGLSYILRFIAEANMRNKYVAYAILLLAIFSIPSYAKYNPNPLAKSSQTTSTTAWDKFSKSKLEQYLAEDDVVFVYCSAEWCATCQINKFTVLNTNSALDLFKEHKIRLLEADLTNQNPEGSNYLFENKSPGLPYAKIYGPRNKTGITLPVLFTYDDILKAIIQVK